MPSKEEDHRDIKRKSCQERRKHSTSSSTWKESPKNPREGERARKRHGNGHSAATGASVPTEESPSSKESYGKSRSAGRSSNAINRSNRSASSRHLGRSSRPSGKRRASMPATPPGAVTSSGSSMSEAAAIVDHDEKKYTTGDSPAEQRQHWKAALDSMRRNSRVQKERGILTIDRLFDEVNRAASIHNSTKKHRDMKSCNAREMEKSVRRHREATPATTKDADKLTNYDGDKSPTTSDAKPPMHLSSEKEVSRKIVEYVKPKPRKSQWLSTTSDSVLRSQMRLELRKETKEGFHILHNYLDCRSRMKRRCKQIQNLESVSAFVLNTDSNGIRAQDSQEFKPQYQQQSVGGRPVKTVKEVYQAAQYALPIFQNLVMKLVEEINEECTHRVERPHVEFAPLRGQDRAQAKADDDYSNRAPGPGVSWLYDIVRGSISLTSSKQILRCLKLIERDPSIHVVSAKNRFATPALTGYRDINICIQVDVPWGFKHICQLQIHHKDIKALDVELCSHMYYEFFRSYFAGSTDSFEDQLEDLMTIGDGDALNDATLHSLLNTCKDKNRLRRLGDLFQYQLCEYDCSYHCYKKLLSVQLEDDGPDDAAVSTYTFVGLAMQKRGDLEEAMINFKKALALSFQIFGKDHASTAIIYSKMGNLLQDQGKFAEAMTLYQKDFCMTKKALGADHGSLAVTLVNMGNVLQHQGQYTIAMDNYVQALDLYQCTVGEEVVAVADLHFTIANLLRKQGRTDEAMQSYDRALKGYTKTLGMSHAIVADTLSNIGRACFLSDRVEEALQHYSKALKLYTAIFGEKSPYTANAHACIGEVRGKQDALEPAMTSLSKALDICTSIGDSSILLSLVTGETRRSIAEVLQKQKKLEEALTEARMALILFMEVLGPDHEEVGKTCSCLSSILKMLGQYTEARHMQARSIAITMNDREKVNGAALASGSPTATAQSLEEEKSDKSGMHHAKTSFVPENLHDSRNSNWSSHSSTNNSNHSIEGYMD
ncbi:MAG: hypothetical protein SGBAC_011671, partial [Bacillariaceae sp.]